MRKRDKLRVQFRLEELKFLIKVTRQRAALRSATQHVMPPKFEGTERKCLKWELNELTLGSKIPWNLSGFWNRHTRDYNVKRDRH